MNTSLGPLVCIVALAIECERRIWLESGGDE